MKKSDTSLKAAALKTSIKEGSLASTTVGLGDSYIPAYVVATEATLPQIAILTSIPSLLGSLAQLISSKLIERVDRKVLTVNSVVRVALTWIPLIGSIFLFVKGVPFIPWIIIFLKTIYVFFNNFALPPWLSWMGDLVPEDKRGRYFGIRNAICTGVLLIATILAAKWLDLLKKANLIFVGFATIFFLAMIFRLLSAAMLKKQYEPKLKVEPDYYFSIIEFVKKMRGNNFGRFTISVMVLYFATFLASPFFTPYLLRELELDYVLFILILTVTPSLIHIAVWPLWGRFSDKYGNVRTLRVCSLIISVSPTLWVFSDNPYYLIFVPQVVSGIGWAGFFLAASNFIYDAVTRQRRGICFAYYNVLSGMSGFLGATIGGIISKLSVGFMNIFLFIFLFSGIMRLMSALILVPKIKEVRGTLE